VPCAQRTGLDAVASLVRFSNLYLYVPLHTLIKKRESEIATGIVRGVAVPVSYRWVSLYTSWAEPAIIQLGLQVVMLIVYLEVREHVGTSGLGAVAYAVLFFGAVGSLAALSSSIQGYRYLLSVLRQAEAD
jgi:hypothetical protein